MKASNACLSIIKKWEGLGPEFKKTLRVIAYLCPEGKPTIGYGHTRTVKFSDVGKKEISLAEADRLLALDVADFEKDVLKRLSGPVTQGQFDALVSLSYNVGSIGTSLAGAASKGNEKEAMFQFRRYIHAKDGQEQCRSRCGIPGCTNRIYQGLINRREDELKTLWLATTPAPDPVTMPTSTPSLNARIKEQTAIMKAAAAEIERLLG